MNIVQRITMRIPYLQKSADPNDLRMAEVLSAMLNMREAIALEANYLNGSVEGAMLQASTSSIEACLEIVEQLWERHEDQ
jgi:hypothetical protein